MKGVSNFQSSISPAQSIKDWMTHQSIWLDVWLQAIIFTINMRWWVPINYSLQMKLLNNFFDLNFTSNSLDCSGFVETQRKESFRLDWQCMLEIIWYFCDIQFNAKIIWLWNVKWTMTWWRFILARYVWNIWEMKCWNVRWRDSNVMEIIILSVDASMKIKK
jgi:hypothetical protein